MRLILTLTLAMAVTAIGLKASAETANTRAQVLPTLTRATEAGVPILRRPIQSDGLVFRIARQLDSAVTEAAQDLGLSVNVARSPHLPSISEDALVGLAHDGWVISPRIWEEHEKLRLRLVAVRPGSNILLLRSELVSSQALEMHAVLMLRDLITRNEQSQPKPALPLARDAETEGARSEGRAVLAINSAALGAYVGFAVQRSSGSDDPRLTYPLMALGTGVGFGASMIIADEWAIGIGDAWYLSAGTWWPAAAAFFLAGGYGAEVDDRHAYAVLGATGGLSLAATSLSFASISEGGALLTHSGGAFGMLLGGLGQLIYVGRSDITPERGMGYGTAVGTVLAGAMAAELDFTPARVLMIDVAASLGALGGAAVASPALLVDDELGEGGNRLWLSSVAAGTLIGGALGVWLTAPGADEGTKAPANALAFMTRALPYVGAIGQSRTRTGERATVFGGGVQGRF